MARAFLSHSSAQKLIVNVIANKVGHGRCVVDNVTFGPAMGTLEEILDGLESSDLFVVFLSDSALESDWVKREIRIAKEYFDERKIHRIYPIIIDENITHEDRRIPDWMRDSYNLRRVLSLTKCANLIGERLRVISWKKSPALKAKSKTFVGRNDLIDSFEERMNDYDHETPLAIIASGMPSIGRRSFIKHVLEKVNTIKPSSDPPEIEINETESIEDFILGIYNLGLCNVREFPDFMETSRQSKIKIAIELLKEIQESQEIIFILDNGGIVLQDRTMVDWFREILEDKDNLLREQLVVCLASRYKLIKHIYRGYDQIFSFSVEELKPTKRKGLFNKILSEWYQLKLNKEDFVFFTNMFKGFPEQIYFAAELIQEEGIAFAKENKSLIQNFEYARIHRLLKKYEENEVAKNILGILAEFGVISSNTLFELIGDVKREKCFQILNELIGSSFCSFLGVSREYYRLNTAVQDYIKRGRFDLDEEVKKRLEQHVLSYEPSDDAYESDIADHLYSIKRSLKMGIKVSARYLIPSIYVKTIAEQYHNHKNYENVIVLTQSALENIDSFEFNLIRQIKYFRCLSLARLKNEKCTKEIQFFKKNKLVADYHFLLGFHYRMIGKPRYAIDSYREALKEDPRSRKIKRELVIVFSSIEEYHTAYKLAEENYRNDPGNPFQIQAYFNCILRSKYSQDKSVEGQLRQLISELQNIPTKIADEMSLLAEAEFLSIVEGDYESAVEKINICLTAHDYGPYSLKTFFDLNERHEKFQEMGVVINTFEKKIRYPDPSIKNTLKIMKAKYQAHLGNLETAINLLDQLNYLPEGTKENLKRKIRGIYALKY